MLVAERVPGTAQADADVVKLVEAEKLLVAPPVHTACTWNS